jgi:putative AdoMet-dependent methyltransferase
VINYGKLLQTGGKIVFADTMFETADSFADTIVQAKQKGYTQLAEDLEREYYTTIPVLKQIFESNGFHITFTQFNHFVWVLEATKQ